MLLHTPPVPPELTQGLSSKATEHPLCSSPDSETPITIPLPVSGQRAQPPPWSSPGHLRRDWGEKRRGEREREGVSRLRPAPRKWAGKRNEVSDREGGGSSSSAGSLGGSPEVSSARCAEALTPRTAAKPPPSQAGLWPSAALPPLLRTWHPGLSVCRDCTTWAPSQLKTGLGPTTSSTLGPVRAAAKA